MNTKKYFKWGLPLVASTVLAVASCSKYWENRPYNNTASSSSQSHLLEETNSGLHNPTDKKDFSKIEWILTEKDGKTICGTPPDSNAPKSLEEMVFTDKDPLQRELTEWEVPALARLIPIKKFIERDSAHYSINPMWGLQFFTFESSLDPTAINKMSNDFGLGQIKRESEKSAKSIGTNQKHPLYSSHLDKDGNIFDPETNIIMSMLLNRYNMMRLSLKTSDQAYAVYSRNTQGLNQDGSPSPIAVGLLLGLHERYNYFEQIIPLFRLRKDDLGKIKNPNTKSLLEIYHKNLGVEETYRQELEYFLKSLENNLKGDARSVLVYDDCVVFAKTVSIMSGVKQDDYYRRLLDISDKLTPIVMHPELKMRMERTTALLKEAMLSPLGYAVK